MRTLLFVVLSFLHFSLGAQEKYEYTSYNKLIDVTGTDYTIATFEDHSKRGISGRHILFINTRTGSFKQVSLDEDEYLYKIEQIRLDSLGINRIIAVIGMGHPENMKGLMLGSWHRVVVFSTDGNEMLGAEGPIHFASTWQVKERIGSLVIAGHTDSDGNGKHDRTDKNQVLVYDLKNMKVIGTI